MRRRFNSLISSLFSSPSVFTEANDFVDREGVSPCLDDEERVCFVSAVVSRSLGPDDTLAGLPAWRLVSVFVLFLSGVEAPASPPPFDEVEVDVLPIRVEDELICF